MIRKCSILHDLKGLVSQGDIYRNVHFVEQIEELPNNVINIKRILFPYVIVLSQDCDLSQDQKNRWSDDPKDQANFGNRILSTLVAPLYNAEHVFVGDHLTDLEFGTVTKFKRDRTDGKMLAQNKNARYHSFSFAGIQLPDMICDFKHYFSVSLPYLRDHRPKNYVCKIGDLYREEICQRFSFFLSRIALPD